MSSIQQEPRYVPYLAGLFDGGGSIYFRISKSNRDLGYRINPTIILHLQHNDALYGMLDEILVSEHIQFKVSKTDSNARRMEIDTRNNVKRFLKLVGEHTIQHSPETNFILNTLFPARDSGEILNKSTFIRMVETIELMQPRRRHNDGVKYTTDYFYEMWDIENQQSPTSIQVPEETYPSKEYIAGMFDGAGKIRPIVHESDSTDLGYSISLRVGITRSWLRDVTAQTITRYLDDLDILYNTNQQNFRLSIHLTHHDSIRELLKSLQPLLIANFEIAALTLHKILPAFEDGYHRTKQGMHDIIALFELVIDSNSEHRKYTSDYFQKLWDCINTLDMAQEIDYT